MDQLTLVLTNMMRKPTRAGLTVATLVIAFLLFMLLRAVASAFTVGITPQSVQRLYIDARYSMVDNLPVAHVHAVRQIPGIRAVSQVVWFGAHYQDPSNTFPQMVVDPEAYLEVFPELRVTPDVLDRMLRSRRTVVVADHIAAEYGWSVGEIIPLVGAITPRADGTPWEFELAGTYEVVSSAPVLAGMLIQHEYFNESVPDWAENWIYWMVARVEDGLETKPVVDAIDGLFENSSDPTRSRLEDDYARQFVTQLGDIGAITTLILIAVFFTIILLTGNVTSLSFRERVPELAVMKTLGFEDGFVARMVIAEAVLMCVLGAAGGVLLAYLVAPALNAQLAGVMGGFELSWVDALSALGLSVIMGALIALPSARAAGRLAIVDALKGVH